MTSRAARLRRKKAILGNGGRPRIDGPREPNGRLDRAWRSEESVRDARRTATEARQRHYGLTADQASQVEAGTVLGRLRLSGGVSQDQADAAQRYQQIRNRYQLTIGAAPDYREHAPDRESGGELDDWVAHVRAQYDAMVAALTRLCVDLRSPAPKAALDVIVLRDHDMPELVGALRLALNALVQHFAGQRYGTLAACG